MRKNKKRFVIYFGGSLVGQLAAGVPLWFALVGGVLFWLFASFVEDKIVGAG